MRVTVILAVALGVGWGLTLDVRAADRQNCAQGKGTTLAGSAQVRVYQRGRSRVFACDRRSGRTRFLGDRGDIEFSDVESLSVIRVTGRFVAYEHGAGCSRHTGDCAARVSVLHVRSGRYAHRLTVSDPRLAGEPESQLPRVRDLQLRGNGSAAVIIGPNEARELEVWTLDSQGRTRVDRGVDVEAGSLAVNRRWVYWRRAGAAYSARLR